MAKNTVNFEGNLTRALEVRFTPNGKQVATATLIHNHQRKTDKVENGKPVYEKTGEITTMRVVLWQEVLGEYGKGDLLGVEGYLKDRSWVDAKTGEKRTITELIATKVTKHLPKGTPKKVEAKAKKGGRTKKGAAA